MKKGQVLYFALFDLAHEARPDPTIPDENWRFSVAVTAF
jgi:hypothetical protein